MDSTTITAVSTAAVSVIGALTGGGYWAYRQSVKTAAANSEVEKLKATLSAQGIDGGQELEARKIVDTTMLKLADTLNARVTTVETENVTIRGLLHECEQKHGDVREQFARVSEQHRHCESENKRLCDRVSKLEMRVDSVIVNPPPVATTGQNPHPTNVYVQVGPEAGATPLDSTENK